MLPDEEWVEVTYQTGDSTKEVKVPWSVVTPDIGSTGKAAGSGGDIELATKLGNDLLLEITHRIRMLLFVDSALEYEAKDSALAGDLSFDDAVKGLTADNETIMPKVLTVRRLDTNSGPVDYLGIRSFNFKYHPEVFLKEVARLLKAMPQNGLILDVRDNPGGYIIAAERLLQMFTDRRIEPERFQFINTPSTRQLIHARNDLDVWKRSADLALQIGTPYTQGFPIESPDMANSIGRKYDGPVVLVTNALCYSACDMFAAGFQDNQVGKILGVDGNTGAGGANVWDHELLRQFYPQEIPPLLVPLPGGADMRVSIRRSVRVGENVGLPLEDLGVVPDHIHQKKFEDITEDNKSLYDEAANMLFN